MTPSILVIDTGTSSMRGILFDLRGESLFRARETYAMRIQPDGAATMDAEVLEGALIAICRQAAQVIQERGLALEGVALDSARSSVLPVSGDMRPLSPILMWYNKRCVPYCARQSREEIAEIYRHSGMRLTPVCSAPKMRWLKDNEPELYRSASKLIGIHDYLCYLVSGELITDAGCACRSALMDIRTFTWSDALLAHFSIEREKLAPIVRSGTVIGAVSDAFRRATGLPRAAVISAGGDQQCCALGQGIQQPGTLGVNSGSASYLTMPIARAGLDPAMEVNLSAYFGSIPWSLEASNMGSGTLYQWFNRCFYQSGQNVTDVTAINAEVSATQPGSDGLICLADMVGRGCPATDPNRRGVFYGVGLQHGRGAFARALLEGICFDIRDCAAHMAALGVPVERIQSTGGLANFSVFNQTLADMTGMAVLVSRQTETTALGAFAAALAALDGEARAAQLFQNIATGQEQYLPDGENHRLYAALLERRRALQRQLTPTIPAESEKEVSI